jgi:SH3-like domain-containing protein
MASEAMIATTTLRRALRCGAVALSAAFLSLALGNPLLAQVEKAPSEKSQKNGKLPRFASLKSEDVNVRTGPGPRYPVDWKFVRRDLPVEIVAEFDTWLKIRDWQNTEGWVHSSMLSQRRQVMVVGDTMRDVRRSPEDSAPVVARSEPGVIGQLLQCEGAWCRVQMRKVTGWIRRDAVWGVYPDEDMK